LVKKYRKNHLTAYKGSIVIVSEALEACKAIEEEARIVNGVIVEQVELRVVKSIIN
jgi:hypothetical protein